MGFFFEKNGTTFGNALYLSMGSNRTFQYLDGKDIHDVIDEMGRTMSPNGGQGGAEETDIEKCYQQCDADAYRPENMDSRVSHFSALSNLFNKLEGESFGHF